MKYFFFFYLFLSVTFHSNSQKKYVFDYILEYDFKSNKDMKVRKIFFLTNSQDDSYECEITEEDESNYNMYFISKEGFTSNSIIDKNEFLKAESISLLCSSVIKQKSKAINFTQFKYTILSDTIISGNSYARYSMQFLNNRKYKKFDKGVAQCIVESNTKFYKPTSLISRAFDIRVNIENVPLGIAKEVLFKSYNARDFDYKYTLKQFVKIKKYIIIPEQCVDK